METSPCVYMVSFLRTDAVRKAGYVYIYMNKFADCSFLRKESSVLVAKVGNNSLWKAGGVPVCTHKHTILSGVLPRQNKAGPVPQPVSKCELISLGEALLKQGAVVGAIMRSGSRV